MDGWELEDLVCGVKKNFRREERRIRKNNYIRHGISKRRDEQIQISSERLSCNQAGERGH